MPTIDGIASGLDTTSLINASLAVTTAQKKPLQAKVQLYTDHKSKLAALSSKLATLADKLDELVDPNTLMPLSATVGAGAAFTVDTTQATSAGMFEVQTIATAQRASTASAGLASATALGSVGEGTLTVTYGGVATAVTIDATNSSLEGVATALSAVSGVNAYVVNTGTAANPYRLVVTGEDTGAANTLTLDTSALTAGSAVQPTFTGLSTASDSHITVNNMDVYSASNTVTGAIPGVTFNLTGVDAAPVRLDLSRDAAGVRGRLEELVTAYNDVVKYYETQTVYNAAVGIKGGLVGESSARRVMNDLGTVAGAEYTTTGVVDALSQLGIMTEQNGTLSLDATKFDAAYTAHYADTVELLTSATGPLAAMSAKIRDVYIDPVAGVFASRTDSLESLIADNNDQMSVIDDRVARQQKSLRARYTALETTMAQLNATSSYLAAILPQTSLIGGSSS